MVPLHCRSGGMAPHGTTSRPSSLVDKQKPASSACRTYRSRTSAQRCSGQATRATIHNCRWGSTPNVASTDMLSSQSAMTCSRRVVLTNLGKIAAIATIVGAIFTVITFFHISKEPTETSVPPTPPNLNQGQTGSMAIFDEAPETPVPPVSSNVSQGKTDSIVCKDNRPRQNTTTTESSSYVLEFDLMTRFNAARKIPGPSSKSKALQKLSKAASDLGCFDMAFTIALDIPSPSTKSKTLRYVAIGAKTLGELKLAIRIAEAIPGPTTRSKTLSDISEINSK